MLWPPSFNKRDRRSEAIYQPGENTHSADIVFTRTFIAAKPNGMITGKLFIVKEMK